MNALAEQLLHGYADGHRLLAGSVNLAPEVQRRLLIHSDALPGPQGGRTLASLPLPEQELWAITATWPALEMPRPGSVWSHTLILTREAVGALKGAGGLLEAFHRPERVGDYQEYRQPLQIIDSPARPTSQSKWLVQAILLGLYAPSDEPAAVVASNLEAAEVALVAAWEQQWPALRMSTSFATRGRIESETRIQVQVGPSLPRGRSAVRLLSTDRSPLDEQTAWVADLANDVFNAGALRDFLRRYGPAGHRGVADVRLLAQFRTAVNAAEVADDAFLPLAEAYPDPLQMSTLKHDCLQRDGNVTRAPESWRIGTAIRFHGSVEWTSLTLGPRLAAIVSADQATAADLLEIGWQQSDATLADELIQAVAERADSRFVAEVARRDVELAFQLVRRRAALLYTRDLWHQPESWQPLLITMLADHEVRDPDLAEPLVNSGNDQLTALAARSGLVPAGAIAEAIATIGFSTPARRRYKQILGKIQDVPENDDAHWRGQALAVLSAKDWQPVARRYAERLAPHVEELEDPARLELATKLLAANLGGPAEREVLRAVFPPLHRSLVGETLPKSQWHLLDRALPEGNAWDRAERLRMALLESIEGAPWTEQEVVQVLRDAGPEAERLRDLTRKRSDLRKWLEDALETLAFWT